MLLVERYNIRLSSTGQIGTERLRFGREGGSEVAVNL